MVKPITLPNHLIANALHRKITLFPKRITIATPPFLQTPRLRFV